MNKKDSKDKTGPKEKKEPRPIDVNAETNNLIRRGKDQGFATRFARANSSK